MSINITQSILRYPFLGWVSCKDVSLISCNAKNYSNIFLQKYSGKYFNQTATRCYTYRTNANLRLVTVGKFDTPKLNGKYETGQLFLHRVFGYRGVILFPWIARVFDRDVLNKKDKKSNEHPPEHIEDPLSYDQVGKELKGRSHTFYQVLIDVRDSPYIRAQTENVTFLDNQDNGISLYAVPGFDYVAHEDIMPYNTPDKKPIYHDLFERFLEYAEGKDPPFDASVTLKEWRERSRCLLEMSDVHKETTDNIRVTVIPFYMGCRTSKNTRIYWWRYSIRLENLGERTVQLRERHWSIFSLSGTMENVRGRGVDGQEPVLSQEHPAFQYSSHVSLQAPSGHMWGTFRMENEDGCTFDCRIPPFSLESLSEEGEQP